MNNILKKFIKNADSKLSQKEQYGYHAKNAV